MSFFSDLTVSWLPKLGGIMSAAGLAMSAGGEPFYGMLLSQAGGALLYFARQNNVTSEDAGIKSPAVIVRVEPPIVVMEQAPLSPTEKRALHERE